MSLRIIYRKVPSDMRICNYYRCRQPILRNIDRDKEGRLYHHGCLMSAQDESWRCRACFLVFDGTEATVEEAQVVRGEEYCEHLRVMCPNCGGSDLKSMGGGC